MSTASGPTAETTMPDDETPEQTARFHVGKIGEVLARAGLPAYETNPFASASPFADPVRQAGYLVCSYATDRDCVYVDWIDHYLGPAPAWRVGQMMRALPVHPDRAARVPSLTGAWCAHPQLPGWKLVEVTLLPDPIVLPWPPALTDAYLCDWLRAEAGRRMGHDPKLISISLPYRDCPRHSPAPIEAAADA